MNFRFQDIKWMRVEVDIDICGFSRLLLLPYRPLQVKKTGQFLLYSHEFLPRFQDSKINENNWFTNDREVKTALYSST